MVGLLLALRLWLLRLTEAAEASELLPVSCIALSISLFLVMMMDNAACVLVIIKRFLFKFEFKP